MTSNAVAAKVAEIELRGYRVKPARLQDVPQMHDIINRFAGQGEMLPRSMSELFENVRDFIVVKQDDQVAACASLHVLWEDLAEIKSVAVSQELQGQGIGALLVERCVVDAAELGLTTVFVLTHKPGFYEKLGFERTDVLSFPRKVWSECIRCPKFPSCNEIAMSRSITTVLTGPLPQDD